MKMVDYMRREKLVAIEYGSNGFKIWHLSSIKYTYTTIQYSTIDLTYTTIQCSTSNSGLL